MSYDVRKLPLRELFAPVTEATAQLSRLDERIARSSIGEGWIERTHFSDACSSLWVDGELVHIEDLVLHDAGHDVREPTRELQLRVMYCGLAGVLSPMLPNGPWEGMAWRRCVRDLDHGSKMSVISQRYLPRAST